MEHYKAWKDIKVIAVDDSGMVLTVLATLLHEFGFEHVLTVASYGSAKEKLESSEPGHFGLIFLDRYIGEDSGIDLLELVRARDKVVPIVMITQEDEASKVMEAIAKGASDYIVKPFNQEIVKAKLERVFGKK
jgi:response regulator of citrate/malate metabolism